MTTTKCYGVVRGRATRVTGLTRRGGVPDSIAYAATRSVSKVTINEVVDSTYSEIMREPDTDETRVQFRGTTDTVRHTVDIDFLRVDPGLFALVAGLVLVTKVEGLGFGEGPYGFGPYGFAEDAPHEVAYGFDAMTRRPAAAFALEVWTKLDLPCGPDGLRPWGYTVFPYLRGGYMTGFSYSADAVTFSLRGAQTRRRGGWAVGPYDLEGPWQRLVTPVSGNTSFRQTITTAQPPEQTDGMMFTEDVINGGTATATSDDVLDGGTADDTTEWIVEGGSAA